MTPPFAVNYRFILVYSATKENEVLIKSVFTVRSLQIFEYIKVK